MPLGRARPYLALASEFTRAALNAVAGRARVILPHIVESRRDASVPSSTVRARDYAAAGVTPMEDRRALVMRLARRRRVRRRKTFRESFVSSSRASRGRA